MRRINRLRLVSALCGLVGGVTLGALTLALDTGEAIGHMIAAGPDPATVIDAAHVPPLLTVPGEEVTLRYAILCPPDDQGLPCNAGGDVYVRKGQSGDFTRVALERGNDSKEGRYFVRVPRGIAGAADGFSYYAVLRNDATGAAMTLPAGGAAAPQRSLPLTGASQVNLAGHRFGHARKADGRILEAHWGSATGELGLSGGPPLGYTGPSSFDVDARGGVTVLDQVNGRAERWPGTGGAPTATPLDLSGGISDMTVEPDGTIDVLEPPDRSNAASVLKSFRPDGQLKWSQKVLGRTWTKLERGPSGPLVQQSQSEQWVPVAQGDAPLDRTSQARRGRVGAPEADGHELVVLRTGTGEIRVADVVGNRVQRGWRIVSDTALGEVQLAERLGNTLVVVTKAYTDIADEFVAVVAAPDGGVQQFAITSAEWAEAAPLARFRLTGTSLYQFGSTPTGVFVDRFDLKEHR